MRPNVRTESHRELLIISAIWETKLEKVVMVGTSRRETSKAAEVGLAPIFRWIHINNDPMSLVDFQEAMHGTPSLTDDEKLVADRTLMAVKDSRVTRYMHGLSMSPGCHYYRSIQSEYPEQSSQLIDVIFFSLPFLDSKPPLAYYQTSSKDEFPSKALYQSHHQSISTNERDRRQVLRSDGDFIFVPQFWCLMIDKKFILTNAPTEFSKLVGDSIQLKILLSPPSAGPQIVYYEHSSGHIFIFPAEKCKTWTGLLGCIKAEVLNSMNDAYPQGDLHFWTEGGVFVTNNNWPQVFESETGSILKLSTVKKTIEPGPPLRTPDSTQKFEEKFEEKSRDLNLSRNSFQCKIITTRGEQRDIRPAGTYGIVSLIIENLLGEVGNILSRYNKAASVLESQVQDIPDVPFFKTLNALNEELRIDREILLNQCEVVDDLQKICNHVSKHDTCSDEFQEHAFSRIIHSLERKVEEVNNMIKRVPEMRDIAERTVTQANDRAIRIFTIVTVVYLPLSFVSGFLGMNTADIRNLNNTQSLFWTIAIPTTVVTLAITLYILAPSLRRRIFSFFMSFF